MISQTSNTKSSAKKKTCKLQISYKKLTLGLQNYKDIKQAHLKNKVCQQSTQFKENKQCTFQPHLSAKKSSQNSENRRSLKKFLEDQEKFSNTKRMKIQQLRQEISKQQEDEFKGKPSIDSVSYRISTQMSIKTNQKVFERLSKQKKNVHDVFEYENMFSPKICDKSKSLKRQKDVSALLYEDAQRRKQKQEMNCEELLKKQFIPEINQNTNDLVIKKIYSEFISMVKSQSISPLLAVTVISEIFNIDLNPNKSQQQEILCEKVLFYIADTKTQTVNTQTLWNFIQTIVNGHLVDSNFSEQQQDQILQSFSYFYANRLTKLKKKVSPQRCSFKPKTLEFSQKLAKNHRLRTLQSINQYLQNQKVKIEIVNNSVRIQDLFIIQHMKKNSQNQRKRLKKQDIQLQQCSFKPNTNLSSTSLMQSKNSQIKKVNIIPLKYTKTQQLQKRLKIKKKEDEENKQNDERVKTMYQNLNGCRQKRVFESTNRSKENKVIKAEVKNIEKSVMRVALGRKNRELVNALNQRGYPQNVQNWDTFRRSLKKGVQKSSQKLLKGYNSLEKSNLNLLKTSALIK